MEHRQTEVGLIGVGLLGLAIAERLLGAGFRVFGWDLDAGRRGALATVGGVAADNARDVLSRCSTVVLSLPTSEVVAAVVEDVPADGGLTIVDTTTGDPELVEAIVARIASLGGRYVDATIAGSSEMLRRGEAIGLVGGEGEAVRACEAVLEAIAPRRFVLGPAGSGSRMKLVVNLVLGLQRAALAEGLGLARSYGMDLAAVLAVLKAGPTYSTVMDSKGPKMISGDFGLEARLSQHHKDVRLILKEAARVGAKTPLSEVHKRLLESLEACGLGGEDNSVIVRAFIDR